MLIDPSPLRRLRSLTDALSDGGGAQDDWSPRCAGILRGHARLVCALAVLPTGELVSAGRDGTLCFWDTAPVFFATEPPSPFLFPKFPARSSSAPSLAGLTGRELVKRGSSAAAASPAAAAAAISSSASSAASTTSGAGTAAPALEAYPQARLVRRLQLPVVPHCLCVSEASGALYVGARQCRQAVSTSLPFSLLAVDAKALPLTPDMLLDIMHPIGDPRDRQQQQQQLTAAPETAGDQAGR